MVRNGNRDDSKQVTLQIQLTENTKAYEYEELKVSPTSPIWASERTSYTTEPKGVKCVVYRYFAPQREDDRAAENLVAR
jgi:hypothetical protein